MLKYYFDFFTLYNKFLNLVKKWLETRDDRVWVTTREFRI